MELNIEMVNTFLAQIAELDQRMTDSAGTVSQRKAEAAEAIRAAEAASLEGVPSAILNDDMDRPYLVCLNYDRAAADLEKAKSAFDEAKQAFEDAVVAHLKARKADVGTELVGLKAQRETLVTQVKAMGTLLGIDVEVPKAPKGAGSGSSGGSRAAKSSTGSHYVKAEDGTISSYANDSFSGLAFYAFRVKGVSPTAADLEAAVSDAGIADRTKEWETTVTLNGVTRTIGHRVEETSTETS